MLCRESLAKSKTVAFKELGDLCVLFLVQFVSRLDLIVLCLLVNCHITGECNRITCCTENIACIFNINSKCRELCGLHLARYESFPDKLVDLVLIGCKVSTDLLRLEVYVGGTDSFVSVLCSGLCLVNSGLFCIELFTVLFTDELTCSILRFSRYTERVCTHVSDKTLYTTVFRADIDTFVKLLSNSHCSLGLEGKLLGCFLLECRCDKRRCGSLCSCRSCYVRYLEAAALDSINNLTCLLAVFKLDLAILITVELNCKGLTVGREKLYVDSPVFNGNEALDLVFALNDDSCRNGLNSTCGKTALYVLPKKRRELVAHDSVKNSSCLLSIYNVHIDLTRLLYCRLNHALCDFVERYSHCLFKRNTKHVCKMPSNRLTLTVRVSCEEDLVCCLCFLLDFLDKVALTSYVNIMSLEILLDVNTHAGLRKVANVTNCRHYLIV